jgi:hypothetical protein
MRSLPAAALDVLAVVAFVVLGRRTHADGLDPAGVAGTAWPFLAALAVGWLLARAWRAPAAVARTGVPVWLVTVAGGMLLRRLAGEGTAPSFVVVTALTLAVFLLGWRAAALAVPRLRGTARSR